MVNIRTGSSGCCGNSTTSSLVPLTPINHVFQATQPVGLLNSNTHQTPLVHCTHLFAPMTPLNISDSNKENGPTVRYLCCICTKLKDLHSRPLCWDCGNMAALTATPTMTCPQSTLNLRNLQLQLAISL